MRQRRRGIAAAVILTGVAVSPLGYAQRTSTATAAVTSTTASTTQVAASPSPSLAPLVHARLHEPARAASRAVSVIDDGGNAVTLARPAARVISLAPHATELIFAAGGGDRLVGAVDYSDYPAAARNVPRVGSNTSLDLERIAALRPDLIVVWRHGNVARQIDALHALGVPLFVSEPRHLDDIGATLHKLGILLGTTATADRAASAYAARLHALRDAYANRPPISVFYQVWGAPLMTLNGTQIISEAMRLCGGRNVFADLRPIAPTVSTEAVLAAAPEVIVAPGIGATASATPLADLTAWRAWPQLPAVRAGNLFVIDGDLLNRPGPRILAGTAALCADLDRARAQLRTAAPR